jgi:hypothetical protein
MKGQIYIVLSALTILSVSALGQCARPEMNPVWDAGTQQFTCVAPSGSVGTSHDDTVAPKGDKQFCSTAHESLLKACPASEEGKTCKNKAKSIFNSCYKDSQAQSANQAGSGGDDKPSHQDRSRSLYADFQSTTTGVSSAQTTSSRPRTALCS